MFSSNCIILKLFTFILLVCFYSIISTYLFLFFYIFYFFILSCLLSLSFLTSIYILKLFSLIICFLLHSIAIYQVCDLVCFHYVTFNFFLISILCLFSINLSHFFFFLKLFSFILYDYTSLYFSLFSSTFIFITLCK